VGPPSPVRRSKSGESGERVTTSGRQDPPGAARASRVSVCATFGARAVIHHASRRAMKIHHLYVDKQGESHF
jgi:hypothetical protein